MTRDRHVDGLSFLGVFLVKGFCKKKRSHKLLISKNIYSNFFVFLLCFFLYEILPEMHFNLQSNQME